MLSEEELTALAKELWAEDGHPLAEGYIALLVERDALKAQLEQARSPLNKSVYDK